MRTIRASEIGTYLYCQRAWWYQKQGFPPGNQNELASGSKLHTQNTRTVFISGCLRILAYVMLISAILLLVIYTTIRLI
jgi:CRISPR/Cas system-associated exonuclease Cas4 (RecB family)